MSVTDPISDMLTRIRNGYATEKQSVNVPSSKIKLAILEILKREDYIGDFNADKNGIEINLRYNDSLPAIASIQRVSKPGRRIYVKKDEIPSVLSGHGIAVISSPKGIMTGTDAKREQTGGEIICKVA